MSDPALEDDLGKWPPDPDSDDKDKDKDTKSTKKNVLMYLCLNVPWLMTPTVHLKAKTKTKFFKDPIS